MNGTNGRVVAAVVIVAGLVISVPVTDMTLRATGAVKGDAPEHARLSVDELSGSSADELLLHLAEIAENTTAAPSWFDEEIGLLPDARDIRVDGATVGYVVDVDEAQTFEALSELMESGGWTGVSLGGVTGATFVKGDGVCTWALVTCTQVGTATSVVTRVI